MIKYRRRCSPGHQVARKLKVASQFHTCSHESTLIAGRIERAARIIRGKKIAPSGRVSHFRIDASSCGCDTGGGRFGHGCAVARPRRCWGRTSERFLSVVAGRHCLSTPSGFGIVRLLADLYVWTAFAGHQVVNAGVQGWREESPWCVDSQLPADIDTRQTSYLLNSLDFTGRRKRP